MYIHNTLKYEIIDEYENMCNWEWQSVKILITSRHLRKKYTKDIANLTFNISLKTVI